LFFDRLEEEPVSRTDLGAPQVDDIFLDKMAEKYDWCEDLRHYNKLNKLSSTYIERFLTLSENGVFYPRWFMHRTITGRLGGDLMQLPKKKSEGQLHESILKYNNKIRDLIISGKGRKLVGADYSSLEIVVFADDAGDEPLLDIIRNNEDPYSKVAIMVKKYGNLYSANKKAPNFLKDIIPEVRDEAKVYTLGLRYNMQAYWLSQVLKVSEAEAKQIMVDYFAAFPKLKGRMDDLESFAKANGYVKSRGGRLKRVPKLPRLYETYGDLLKDSLKIWKKYHDAPSKHKQIKFLGKEYRNMINAVLNFPIQSMAASITSRACVAIAREIERLKLDAWIIMQIHDEIVTDCNEKDSERVSKTMRYLMENTTTLSVPLTAVPQIGDKYGELK